MVSSDAFSGFFYQACVISPAVSWILKPGRFSKQRALIYATGFLVLLASLSIALQLSEQETNYYYLLGVGRDASLSDIKSAFRAQSITMHPDRNPSENAQQEFTRLREAYDTIADAHKRYLYDNFGKAAVEKDISRLQMETGIGMVSFYGVWTAFTYVLTLSDNAREARAWSYAAGVLFLVIEINLLFGGASLTTSLFPYMTTHEFIQLLRSSFAPIVNGCRTVGSYLHHDIAHSNFAISVELLKSHKAILLSMRQLQGELASSARHRPDGTANRPAESKENVPPGARKRMKMEKHPSLKTNTLEKEDASGEDVRSVDALMQPKAKVQQPQGYKIPPFVYFIVLYFAVNYFFG